MILLISLSNVSVVFIMFGALAIINICATYFSKKNVILRELKKSNTTRINRAQQNKYVKLLVKL